MNEKEYLEKAKRTLSTQDNLMEHMAYGLVTETAEILDAFKKHKFYGRELNVTNLKEELGDCMWYMYQLLEALDYTPEQCRKDNIEKLRKRYSDKFNDVIDRNMQDELSHINSDK
ncbi:nucleoside triphosphate pyrophosphohydrolase family protein [Aliarcobacter cryaerophilus]|uniref:nucleoside triphosphate pyrophosphohydrolase family protein n=1 Tax=Aliarcobacter cryaerophilus TaxID=28198 RepID=UPI003DA460DA